MLAPPFVFRGPEISTRRGRLARRVVVFLAAVFASCLLAAPALAHDPVLERLQARARQLRLARSRTWQVLLHYRPTPRGTWRSEADGLGFFFAGRRGKIDPQAELDATLAAFRAAPPPPDPRRIEETQPAQCRFPARWAFLKTALAFDPAEMPDRDCPLFAAWRQAIAPERVTLVFASSYLNSPASMYGHTFLRLSRATGEGNPLLDYVINFAADNDTDNGLLYAVKGVSGGFKGHFYTAPYYVKIQEYSHIESRDLWEYELSLDRAQAERLVQHAFETRSTHFSYFFLSENCSYFLLGLLEVADPRLRLTDQFPGAVIPGETVRAILAVPGLVRGVRGRPSLRAELMARKRSLSSAELGAVEALAAAGAAAARLGSLRPERQAFAVDTANELLRYREGLRQESELSPEFKRKERELLVLRGRTGVGPLPSGALPATLGPEHGHRSFRMGLGAGASPEDGPFQTLSLRWAIHDYLDPPRAYAEDAVLEMGNLRLRFDDRTRTLAPERADILQIVSASPVSRWGPKPSWRVRLGGEQARELGCAGWGCLWGGASAGGGVAVRPAAWGLLMAFFESELAGGAPFEDHFRAGLGGSAAAVLRAGQWSSTELGARYIHFMLGDTRRRPVFSAGQAFHFGRHAQLRITAETRGRSYADARLELHGYF